MANVNVTWTLPDKRESGRPLLLADIKHVDVQISADQGASFVSLNEVAPPVKELRVTELEPGTYNFRLIVVDKKDRVSKPATASITIEDTTPPGAALNVAVALI